MGFCRQAGLRLCRQAGLLGRALFFVLCCLLVQAIQGGLEGIRRLEQRHISVAEAKSAAEVFFIGSSLPVMPVVQVRGWG